MNVVVTIQHPAHVHLFREAIGELEASDEVDRVDVFVREKEFVVDLLETYDIEHTVLADAPTSTLDLFATQAQYELALLRRCRRLDPDVVVSVGGLAASHVATALGCRSVVFTDTERATLQNALAFPFADRICTPDCYLDDVGAKQFRYPSYHELAYLHPDRFTPSPDVLDRAGVDPEETFVVLRLVAWRAAHDIGAGGFDDAADVVERFERAGARVLVTSEAPLPPAMADREVTVAPHEMHDLLAYADLFVGESATMAIESAVLGTPSVLVTSLHGLGVIEDLEDTYGLLDHFSDERRQSAALERATELVAREDDGRWARRRERLLVDKVDTTEVIVEQVLAGGRANERA